MGESSKPVLKSMEDMKISFITTVLNEEKNIDLLLKSLFSQTKKPDEIIIVDGGSTDNTLWVMSNKSKKYPKIKFFKKKGNRSVGRNEGIRRATRDIILLSDAGCVLDRKWVEKITEPFESRDVDVVAGYYKTVTNSVFEKCLTPYVLVMPDRVDPNNFLPSARSMAFKKSIWKRVGGFPKDYSSNEDYVFARGLKKIGAKIVFKKDAVVKWIPRENLKDAFLTFFGFAFGDAESKILRPKVILVFARYILGFFLLLLFWISGSLFYLKIISYILFLYIIWAIYKNYHYVRKWQALFLLPLIQFTADFAVLTGTTIGLLKNLWATRYRP